jgi:hypothetical protein
MATSGPLWSQHPSGVQAAQKRRLHRQQLRGLPHRDRGIVLIVEPTNAHPITPLPDGHRRHPTQLAKTKRGPGRRGRALLHHDNNEFRDLDTRRLSKPSPPAPARPRRPSGASTPSATRSNCSQRCRSVQATTRTPGCGQQPLLECRCNPRRRRRYGCHDDRYDPLSRTGLMETIRPGGARNAGMPQAKDDRQPPAPGPVHSRGTGAGACTRTTSTRTSRSRTDSSSPPRIACAVRRAQEQAKNRKKKEQPSKNGVDRPPSFRDDLRKQRICRSCRGSRRRILRAARLLIALLAVGSPARPAR